MRLETVEDLQRTLDSQAEAIRAMGALLEAMDLKIRTVVTLMDSHQVVLLQAGLLQVRPRPIGDPRAN